MTLKLVKDNQKEKEEAEKEFLRLLKLASAYLKEAQKLQEKYNIKSQ